MLEFPSFQEQVQIDVDTVFFNETPREFVTRHRIGGIRGKEDVELAIIADYELFQERKVKDSVENISLDGLIIFVKKTDWIEHFSVVPKVSSILMYDGRKFQVEAVSDDMDVFEITLTGTRG